MKVKKTYGKQKTAVTSVILPRKPFNDTLDEDYWQDDEKETTFDRLLDKKEPNKQIRNKIRADFNRDSSLDESKKQKVKIQKETKQTKKKPKPKYDDSSPDEFFEMYLAEKKQIQKLKKQQRAAVRKVEISTPVQKQMRKKKENLLFEISPIRPDDTVFQGEDYDKTSLYEELHLKSVKEIGEENKTRRAPKRPLASSDKTKVKLQKPEIVNAKLIKLKEKLSKDSKSAEDSLFIRRRRTANPSRARKSRENKKGCSINLQDNIKESSLEVAETNTAEDVLQVDENSLEVPLDIEEEAAAETLSQPVTENSMTMKPPQDHVVRLETCDNQTEENVIEEIANQISKRSVAINLERNISYRSRSSVHETKCRTIPKKSVAFSRDSIDETSSQNMNLPPGKWRKSLVAWRKSRNMKKTNLRRTSVILEESETSKVVEYSEKLLNVLGDSVLLEQSDEGNLHAALSILDASIKCAATFHDQRKISQRQTSVFERTSIFYGLQAPLIDAADALSARQIALRRCGQQEPLPFDETYSESQLPNCCKIGEGVYGEVFMYKCPTTHQPIVLKIIPIEGALLVNGEPQKCFDEILQEIIISMELSGLRHGKEYSTDGFVNVKRVTCVEGAYPLHLIDEWELYRDNRAEGSDNDHPEIFGDDQLYVVFELCNGGRDLEAFVFNNAAEAQSVFLQTALTLAVAEQKFQFEHRDLHWGNILIAPTTEKFCEFRFGGKVVKLLTHGVKVTIIDYSLSRMVYDGAVLYDNLARDEELFQSNGDYQFDIYRLMRDRVDNDFARYEPFTNLLWLHYIVDKLINGARYRSSKTKKHRAAINELMQERDELLNFTSASDYVSHMDI